MTRVIAEIGLNHNGSERRAWGLLNAAVATDIDGITFQIREEEFYDGSHPRKRELSGDFYRKAIQFIRLSGKSAGIALAQPEKLEFFHSIGVEFWKTLSWDLNNLALHESLQRTGKKVYVSTGMSGIEEIVALASRLNNIEFIHTQLNYNLADVNLKALSTIRQASQKPVAFGLHNDHHEVLFTSLGLEPDSIFFYIKDDSNEEHADDEHAIATKNLKHTAQMIKQLSVSLGDGEKRVQKNELHPEDDLVCQ